jgi:hypothetical protein
MRSSERRVRTERMIIGRTFRLTSLANETGDEARAAGSVVRHAGKHQAIQLVCPAAPPFTGCGPRREGTLALEHKEALVIASEGCLDAVVFETRSAATNLQPPLLDHLLSLSSFQ